MTTATRPRRFTLVGQDWGGLIGHTDLDNSGPPRPPRAHPGTD
ncbi:hypothetical protein FBY41_0118 [Humibacillus xanthopallidus]|uniref:Uncharacterized protein n=1 Tax=Humibacillus xanthopallidus TaxID=412689 RepID=A0A543HZN1_9MICO|nr:hypothetical protein FBY41_0118 [Humibacillus xanthopallidus]